VCKAQLTSGAQNIVNGRFMIVLKVMFDLILNHSVIRKTFNLILSDYLCEMFCSPNKSLKCQKLNTFHEQFSLYDRLKTKDNI